MADFEEALNNILSDPQAMGQILALAGQLGGTLDGETPEETPPPPAPASPLPDLDLVQLGKLLELFQSTQGANQEAMALLTALRPFLRAERQRKLDRAIRLAGLSQTAQKAYRLWKGGELHL